ncbi:MAG: PQQ-binding-like beta-propeller repeat protein [Planctomycetota bacterium]
MTLDKSGSRVAVVTNGDHSVKIWSIESGSLQRRIEVPPNAAYSVAWLDDHLIMGGVDGYIRTVDLDSGEIASEFPAHESRVMEILVHPDQQRLFSIGLDSKIGAWELETGRELWVQMGNKEGRWWPQGVLAAVLLPERDLLATGAADGKIKLWSLEDGRQCDSWQTEARVIDGLDVSADGRFLLSGGYEPSRLVLWDIDSGRRVWSQQSSFNYRFPKFSSDDSRIFSGGIEGALGVWDAVTGRRVVAFPSNRGNQIFQLDVSNEDLVVTGDDSGILQFWGFDRFDR